MAPIRTPDRPTVQRTRPRLTIRRLMLLVLVVALNLGFLTAMRRHVQRWEGRRVVMYRQRDLTARIVWDAATDLAATRGPLSLYRPVHGTTYTSRWTERLIVRDRRDGAPVARVVVSGSNGRFRLAPITIEPSGLPDDDFLVNRLTHAYREKGWRYRVIRRLPPADAARR